MAFLPYNSLSHEVNFMAMVIEGGHKSSGGVSEEKLVELGFVKIEKSQTDLTAGVSELEDGKLYLVYE